MSQTVDIIVEPNIIEVEVITDALKANINKPILILTDGSKTINWQTDLVPNDTLNRTYAEVYGNTINTVTGNWLVETDTYQGYQPEYTYTLNSGLIDVVSFPLLQIGFINFL